VPPLPDQYPLPLATPAQVMRVPQQ
jgi:hypothetical protein